MRGRTDVNLAGAVKLTNYDNDLVLVSVKYV